MTVVKLFKNILYVSEDSVEQSSSIERAVSLAENNQANLSVIDVVPRLASRFGMLPGGRISIDDLQAAMVSEREKQLDSLIEPYGGRLEIQTKVLAGVTFLEVIRVILREHVDLLIKPAENPSFFERLFGSDDTQLLRNCPCPVWLTNAARAPSYACVVAAIDFNPYEPDAADDDLNQHILTLASSLALSDFAALHVVHAWDAPGELTVSLWSDAGTQAGSAYVEGVRASHESALHRYRQRLQDRIGEETFNHLSPRFHLLRGAASRVIPEFTQELQADVMVMGTLARSGIAGLLIGNTAEAILEQLQCSVLAVKPSGFVSPVKLSG